jgi:hypothetical protein
MRFKLMIAAAIAAVGFSAPVQAGGCSLEAARPWTPFRGADFVSEAYSNGPTCASAVATIVVRDPKGRVLWADALVAEHVMTFVDAKVPNKMKAALSEWLTQQHLFKSSADLPAWRQGADAPDVVGDFPFYAEPGLDRAGYEQIRAQRQALFCYVQGMESLACIAIGRDGTATKVGVQSFPG